MKVIKSKQDLAINGAEPLFSEMVHVGKPNVGDKKQFLNYVEEMFERGWLTNNGPLVQALEEKVASYHNVKDCVAMCNGTIALEIAIRALDLKDEVIVPSYTFIATAHALHWQGIKPVFADIDPVTHTLDPESVKRLITPDTSAILAVHLWGRPSLIRQLEEIATEYNLKLMFDAAHAFGCSSQGTMIGNFGSCEVLSFHATKFFNTFEGGAVLTNDSELAERMRLMRNFGFSGLDNVIYPGTNGKMPEVSAAMGLANLAQIEKVIEKNKQNYIKYKQELDAVSGVSILQFDLEEKNNYQYVVVEITTEEVTRDKIVEALYAENIRARKYFWPGCHKMKTYESLYPEAGNKLPNTNMVSDRVIVLPTGMAVSEKDIEGICSVIKVVVGK